jgi:PAS domain S-box-containing protein
MPLSLFLRRTATGQTLVFCLLVITLGLWIAPAITWRGSPMLHIALEFIAGLLGLVIATGSIVRYAALGHRHTLLFGLSFLGAGVADLFHTLIALNHLITSAGTDPATWTAGRMTHALLFVASLAAYRYAPRSSNVRREWVVATVATLVFTGAMPFLISRYLLGLLSTNIPPIGWVSEWILIILFLTGAWGYWRLFVTTKITYFDWAAASALVLSSVQVYTARNFQPNDIYFMTAHILKDFGYLIALVGLYIESLSVLRNLESQRATNERYRSVIEAAKDCVVMADGSATILLVNRSAAEALGYEPEELVHQPLTAIIPERFRDAHRAGFQRYHETRVSRVIGKTVELAALRKDGSEFPMELSLAAGGSGEDERFIGIFRDITERKQVEETLRQARIDAEAANKAKSEFLASMSHEIRTPMNGVIGMLGLLLDTKLTGEQEDYANTARASADALLTIINDILDFSKIEAGKLDIEPIPFDLRQAVEEVAELMSPRVMEKELDLIVRYAQGIPDRFIGDPGRIRQVLINLAGNAVKFTHTGHVLIEVDQDQPIDGGMRVRLSVQDTGIGIPQDRLEGIFEKFSQVDASMTRRYGGTGLGLSISRHLVELMNGTMGVTSQEGSGSTFWFMLPLQFDARPSTVSLPDIDLTGLRVLIVDDNMINRRVLVEQLTSWKMRNDEVPSAAAALVKLKEAQAAGDPYQIAILDYQMPEIDGETLGRAIKTDPTLWDTILIMLTSIGQRGEAARFADLGFTGYLIKPVRQSQLMDALALAWSARASGQSSPFITRHLLAESRKAAAGEAVAGRSATARPIGHIRVLVVEDNTVNQKVAVRILDKLGCRTDVAANGREAVDMVDMFSYDVVFMDCQMPEMDGFEATAEIRKRHGAIRRIPIVAMTAHALQGDRERCLEAGMDDYISKPVKISDFETMLDRWIKPESAEGAETAVPERAPDGGTATAAPAAAHPAAVPIPPSDMNIREPVLDTAVLADLRELADDRAFLSELFGTFQRDAVQRLAGLRQAAGQEDALALQQIAHALKGASRNIGARRMAALCQYLEELGAARNVTGVLPLIDRIEQAFNQVQEALHKEIGDNE